TSSARPPPYRQLLQLLDHPSADVRRSAASAMEHLPDPAFVTAIRGHLGDCDDPKLKSALLSALLACAPNEINELAPFLQADSATCNGAMVALLKHGGLEGALLAGERLLEAIRSQDIEERKQ